MNFLIRNAHLASKKTLNKKRKKKESRTDSESESSEANNAIEEIDVCSISSSNTVDPYVFITSGHRSHKKSRLVEVNWSYPFRCLEDVNHDVTVTENRPAGKTEMGLSFWG